MSRSVGLLATGALLAVIVPAPALASAAGGTAYGGSAVRAKHSNNPTIAMVVAPDGTISARAGVPYRCHGHMFTPLYVRLRGSAHAPAFTLSGRTRLPGVGMLHVRAKGTLDGQSAAGTVTFGVGGCAASTRPFVLRTASAPAAAAAMPAGSTLFSGLTSQSAGGVTLPVSVSVTHTGKVWAIWDATASCHPGTFPLANVTPYTKIRPDGTFTRTERYSIRYRHGEVDHFRVTFSGAFRADGVSGTLEATEHTTQPGKRFRTCSSGRQTWAARL